MQCCIYCVTLHVSKYIFYFGIYKWWRFKPCFQFKSEQKYLTQLQEHVLVYVIFHGKIFVNIWILQIYEFVEKSFSVLFLPSSSPRYICGREGTGLENEGKASTTEARYVSFSLVQVYVWIPRASAFRFNFWYIFPVVSWIPYFMLNIIIKSK